MTIAVVHLSKIVLLLVGKLNGSVMWMLAFPFCVCVSECVHKFK